MRSVHDHTARVSITNVAATGLTMFLCPYAASMSGPVGSPAIAENKPQQGFLPRLAA
jgi:hypothetical protein